ncbi:MAG: chorismate synthase [Prevotellaceae bacterium]|jgi:chorismate synthase|nr:chorismate synthase [Prevotellaceae bacterium]
MNTFGQFFRVSIFGESHGALVGVLVDGCPAGMALAAADFTNDLQRRQSGAKGTTARREADIPDIVSGVYNGYTTGAPIAILFANGDARPADYERFRHTPRPGHADFTASQKWSRFNDLRGSGHFSGRLTVALVAAGVIAKKLIAPVAVAAELTEAGGCAHIAAAVEKAVAANDSIGGVVTCSAKNIPAGWGSPFFNSVESLLSHLIFSIPGIKAVEFGAGFEAARMCGSEHNDAFISAGGATRTNHAGGVNGGITNGNELRFRVAVKPTASIARQQTTLNMQTGQPEAFSVHGRHDACIALRVPVIVEAATAIVLADLAQARKNDTIEN